MNWEVGIDIYTLLCIKYITNENLLYCSGNSVLSGDLNGKEIEKRRDLCVYSLFTLLYSRNQYNIVKQLILQ